MDVWESETLILRLIAVLFVFALLRFYQRGNATGRQTVPERETVLYIIVVTASAIVNLLRTGGGGFFLTLTGALAALAVALPLLVRRSLRFEEGVSVKDLAPVAAAGALLGPLGGLAAVAIAAVLYAAYRIPGRQPALAERMEPSFPSAPERTGTAGGSILTMVENRRMRGLRVSCPIDGLDEAGRPEGYAPARSYALTWRTSLAVAMLALLLTGAFI